MITKSPYEGENLLATTTMCENVLAAWEEGREPLEKDALLQAIWADRAFGSPLQYIV